MTDGQSGYSRSQVDNALTDFRYKTLKEYTFKNETQVYLYFRLGKMNFFISEIRSVRVNGFQRDSLCTFMNGTSSRIRGTAPNREWNCYIGIDKENYVYVAVASYSICTIKITPYSVTDINPIRYYETPLFVAVD